MITRVNSWNYKTQKQSSAQANAISGSQFKGVQNSKISFKSYLGGGVNETLLVEGIRFVADVAAIVIACSWVDNHFRSKDKQIAQEYGIRVFHRDHPKIAEEVRVSTYGIVNYLNKSSNGKFRKIAQNIKNSYRTHFQDVLSAAPEESKPHKKISTPTEALEEIRALYKQIDDVFVDIDDDKIDSAIARPFLRTLKKAAVKIQKTVKCSDFSPNHAALGYSLKVVKRF